MPKPQAEPEPVKISFKAPPEPVVAPTPALPYTPPPRQIVETQQAERKPVQPTDLLAPKDSAAEEESIASAIGRTENAVAEEAQEPEEPQPERPPVPDSVSGAKSRENLQKLVPKVEDLLAGTRSQQSNYIDRKLGSVTLLNAHSAPWSQYLIDNGHRTVRYLTLNGSLMSWYYNDVQRLDFPVTVELRLDAQGSVLESKLTRSSRSSKVDRWFRDAFQSGFASQSMPPDLQNNAPIILIGQLYADRIAVGIP